MKLMIFDFKLFYWVFLFECLFCGGGVEFFFDGDGVYVGCLIK